MSKLTHWNGEVFLKSVPTKEAFMDELQQLCIKYDVSIEHEDYYGAFILKKGYSPEAMVWMRCASVPGWKEGE